MKKVLLLTLLFAAVSIIAAAQQEGNAKVWYMNGAAYMATFDPQTKNIRMEGGTMTEGRSFTLKVQNPDDPFAYDVIGGQDEWTRNRIVMPDVIDGKAYYVFMDKEFNTVSLMYQIESVAMLEDIIKSELASLVEAEYKDEYGRRARITEGFLQLPGEKGHNMTFGVENHTPVNVMVAGGKCWRFTASANGLMLVPATFDKQKGVYVSAKRAEPLFLIRQNGTMGRWPNSSSVALQHSALRYLNKQALRYMRSEIKARLGLKFTEPDLKDYFNKQPWYRQAVKDGPRTHYEKMEQHNISIIQAEEASRK